MFFFRESGNLKNILRFLLIVAYETTPMRGRNQLPRLEAGNKSASEPSPHEPIVCPAPCPRSMRHRFFPYDEPRFPGKKRMEEKITPVEPAVEWENGGETFPSQNPERASAVVQRVARDQIPESIGKP